MGSHAAMPSAMTGKAFATAEAAPSKSEMERKAAAGYGYDMSKTDTRSKKEKQMKIDGLVVTGGLSSEAVRKAFDQQSSSLKGCGAAGNVRVKIMINADGTVKSAEVLSKGSKGKARQCILDTIRNWKFGPSSGQETKVTVTLVFAG
jgi:TonB family protein